MGGAKSCGPISGIFQLDAKMVSLEKEIHPLTWILASAIFNSDFISSSIKMEREKMLDLAVFQGHGVRSLVSQLSPPQEVSVP